MSHDNIEKHVKIYKNVFIALLVFTVITVGASYIHFNAVWLGILIGWEKPIFKLGAQPFLLAELFKILLILFLIPSLLKFKKVLKII